MSILKKQGIVVHDVTSTVGGWGPKQEHQELKATSIYVMSLKPAIK